MTFWQENYGFVKDVYDFRLQKYQEWMDNLEAIVSKVMAPNVQYTYKEFKMIQDSLSVSIWSRLIALSFLRHTSVILSPSWGLLRVALLPILQPPTEEVKENKTCTLISDLWTLGRWVTHNAVLLRGKRRQK